jgi:DNA-binding MarR family transcriptional regulator
MTPHIAERPDVAATDEDVVNTLHDVVRIGVLLAEAFQRRLPGSDAHGEAPFALRKLHEAGRRGMPQVEFDRLLGSSATSATRMIDTMETAGLMVRARHPTDRRIKLIHLTPKGEALVHDLFGRLTRCGVGLRSWTSQEVNGFRAQLDRCGRDIDTILQDPAV